MDLISARWEEDQYKQRCYSLIEHHNDTCYRYLAREAMDSGYPVDFGTFEQLNEKGRRLIDSAIAADQHHYEMDEKSPDAAWRTFRDANPSKCVSIFTRVAAVPLKCHWLELESCDEVADIVDQPAAKEITKAQRHSCDQTLAHRNNDHTPRSNSTAMNKGSGNSNCSQTHDCILEEENTPCHSVKITIQSIKEKTPSLKPASTSESCSILSSQSSCEARDDIIEEKCWPATDGAEMEQKTSC